MKYWIGGLVGWLMAVIALVSMAYRLEEPMFIWEKDVAGWQVEVNGYRACMQNAGKMRCRMAPADFVRYYQLKWWIEESQKGEGE